MTTGTTLFVSDAGPATGGHDMPGSDTSGHVPLTHIQALYFELIRTIQYNTLNGAQVVEDLLQWRALWDSVIADRQPSQRAGPTTADRYNVYPHPALLRTTQHDDRTP